jgi:hypothetical protein
MGSVKGATIVSRSAIPEQVKREVLIEAGYRCGVPTCRTILLLDLHHIVEVSEGGGNKADNLLPLCPTCHALYHRERIPRDAVKAWKAVLVSLSQAFDRNTIDDLLFLKCVQHREYVCTGDGVSRFTQLYAAGLATFQFFQGQRGMGMCVDNYRVAITPKGERLLEGWLQGDRKILAEALAMSTLPEG